MSMPHTWQNCYFIYSFNLILTPMMLIFFISFVKTITMLACPCQWRITILLQLKYSTPGSLWGLFMFRTVLGSMSIFIRFWAGRARAANWPDLWAVCTFFSIKLNHSTVLKKTEAFIGTTQHIFIVLILVVYDSFSLNFSINS